MSNSTDALYINNFYATATAGSNTPATDFPLHAPIYLRWDSNQGASFQLFLKQGSTAIYTGTSTSFTYTPDESAHFIGQGATFVLKATLGSDFMYSALHVTVTDPILYPTSITNNGFETIDGQLTVAGKGWVKDLTLTGTMPLFGAYEDTTKYFKASVNVHTQIDGFVVASIGIAPDLEKVFVGSVQKVSLGAVPLWPGDFINSQSYVKGSNCLFNSVMLPFIKGQGMSYTAPERAFAGVADLTATLYWVPIQCAGSYTTPLTNDKSSFAQDAHKTQDADKNVSEEQQDHMLPPSRQAMPSNLDTAAGSELIEGPLTVGQDAIIKGDMNIHAAASMFGPYQLRFNQSYTKLPYSETAQSDGFLVITIKDGGVDTFSGITIKITLQTGQQFYLSGGLIVLLSTKQNLFYSNTMTLPIQKGQTWTCTFPKSELPSFSADSHVDIAIYWVPIGGAPATPSLAAAKPSKSREQHATQLIESLEKTFGKKLDPAKKRYLIEKTIHFNGKHD